MRHCQFAPCSMLCPASTARNTTQIFMYTLFNSPAPALRELTEFYRTDLDTKTIQVSFRV